jgi:hypothetical protein
LLPVDVEEGSVAPLPPAPIVTVNGDGKVPGIGNEVPYINAPAPPPPPPPSDGFAIPPPPPPATTRYSTLDPKVPNALTLKVPDDVKTCAL